MSYIPTNWENGKTPINAENLNKIEQKLVDLDKNGGGGGGNATVEEMTWAEYESLSEAEKMDGTLRVITDRKAGVRFGNVDISGIGDGTVTGAIAALNSNLSSLTPVDLYSYTQHTAVKDTYVLTKTIKIPANSAFAITARPEYYNNKPTGIRICDAENSENVISYHENSGASDPNGVSCSYSGYVTGEKTLYIYAKWAGSAVNNVEITGFYISV